MSESDINSVRTVLDYLRRSSYSSNSRDSRQEGCGRGDSGWREKSSSRPGVGQAGRQGGRAVSLV